jgi:hypothetical protein
MLSVSGLSNQLDSYPRYNSGVVLMPTISMFYGILIALFYGDSLRHNTPHIHARYQGDKASLAIGDGALLAGELPAKQLRMVQVWIDIHRDELMADWELAQAGEEPFRIAPLQ